jgi:alpha-L-rhamnosidase
LPIRSIRAIARFRDIPYLGSFHSSSERLNKIWETGAYTVHLNMQEYLWDGIKRDRLVWLGDVHPEVMTINNVFGDQEVVRKSLDFGRDTTPLPGWMNGMSSYSSSL